jgi:hypothetical protein
MPGGPADVDDCYPVELQESADVKGWKYTPGGQPVNCLFGDTQTAGQFSRVYRLLGGR